MKKLLKDRFSDRQYELLRALAFEWKRYKCRLFSPKRVSPKENRLHLGSGARYLKGWFNIDMVGSDLNVDIATGHLPFSDCCFDAILSQHVVEHLMFKDEFMPLMKECHRTLNPGGILWLSTPDLEKLALSYINNRNTDMIADRKNRLPDWTMGDVPSQFFMSDMFYQNGEHKVIFDFEMLEWSLLRAGFSNVDRGSESELMSEFPDVPARNDDFQSVYVRAVK